MKNTFRIAFPMAVAALLLPTLGHAQNTQTYDGGTNVWEAGGVTDWDGGTDAWTNGNNASFTAATNDLTVTGTIVTNYMEFDGGATSTTISGGTIDQLPVTAYDPTLINDFAGGPVSISSQIELSDMGGDEQTFVNNYSNYDLELGNIDFGPYTINPGATSDRRVNIYSSGPSGSVTLNGNYTDSAAYGYGELNFDGNGSTSATTAAVLNITSSANFANFTNGQLNNYGGGIFNVNNSTFLPSDTFSATDADAFNEINIQGVQTIAAGIYDSTKNSGTSDGTGVSDYGYEHLNLATANAATWSGAINMDGSNLNLSAVSGGRLTVTDYYGNSPLGLIISGNGTVVLDDLDPGDRSYNEEEGNGYVLPTSTTAADLQSGSTTLIESGTSASAFGSATTTANNPADPGTNATVTAVVKLEAGATLGGTGNSGPEVIAEGATSVLTAGDPGQANLGIKPQIGALTISSVSAANGLTLAFKLDANGHTPGTDNDFLTIGSLSLNGTVTVDITTMDGYLETGVVYTLISGTPGKWTAGSDLNFVFNLPQGYMLDPNYARSGGAGYIYDTDDAAFVVQFALAPEPSTYGLMGLGLLGLVAIHRFRRLAA